MIDTNTQAWMSAAQNNIVISDFDATDVILEVSPYCVMHSAAGYYVGQVCTEWDWDCDMFIPQPWSRDTEYMAEEDAYRTLERWEQEDPGSTILSPDNKPSITAVSTEDDES